jgi:hypothetical protein
LAWERQDPWMALRIENAMKKFNIQPTLDQQIALDKLRIEGSFFSFFLSFLL